MPRVPVQEPGTWFGHYEVLSKLGAGGMGEVYLAKDTRLDRKVAIKFLLNESTEDPNAKKRLLREARAAAKLDHPNICSVYEVSEGEGRGFIVMQYIEGESLDSRLQRNPMKLTEAIEVGIQIADALAEAHSRNIIHRDIKPQNIMIDSRGRAKVMDFGLAKSFGREDSTSSPSDGASEVATASLLTQPGAIVGTVPYMSPEQVRGERLDARSDIFALGSVFYEMLSGIRPFGGANAPATFAAILTEQPPPLARFVTNAPTELERIVAKALRKDPERRYQTAKDMIIDLKHLAEELTLDAKHERSTAIGATGRIPATSPVDPQETKSNVVDSTGNAKLGLVTGIKRHKLGTAVALLLVAGVTLALAVYVHEAHTEAPIDSIAVLPFSNEGHEPDLEYLSDGLTESTINSLTQLANLRVIARSSVFHYKDNTDDPMSVGRELGVRAVLTGRVRQLGDQLIISTELIDVRLNRQLWGERFERKVSDLLVVQREIATEISANLRMKLSNAEKDRLAKSATENSTAYQLYLKGRYHYYKYNREGLRAGIDYFKQAIAIDQNYALAWTGLADCYGLMADEYERPQDVASKWRESAIKALALDDSLAEAHFSAAYLKTYHEWDFAGAEQEYKRAIELNPNYSNARTFYGRQLFLIGRAAEATTVLENAQQFDPLSLILKGNLGLAYFYSGRPDAGIAQLQKTIEIDPHFTWTHVFLGQIYYERGDWSRAIAEFRKEMQIDPNPRKKAFLVAAFARAGQKNDALRLLEEIKSTTDQYVSPITYAFAYAGLGDKEQAFVWLNKAFEERSNTLTTVKISPIVEGLRSDLRFADLLRRIGL